MKTIFSFIKRESVLFIAVVLAIFSMFVVTPDEQYISYIDFRTLAILFSLMAIVSGFRKLGIFDMLAKKMLSSVKSLRGLTAVLIFLCFFTSMVITNDVALITFVPFTIIIMNQMGEDFKNKWLLKIVALQTIAANLGSMFTPIGNPQNLYLFGISNLNILDFFMLMLPFTLIAFALLIIYIFATCRTKEISVNGNTDKTDDIADTYKSKEISINKNTDKTVDIADTYQSKEFSINENTEKTVTIADTYQSKEKLIVYIILLILSILCVGRIIPYQFIFILVFMYTILRDRKILLEVDYPLLATFAALFIFIGNIGRVSAFSNFLQSIISRHEIITSVVASQIMSNVPAAILLSQFTDNISKLIIGINIGGLGTIIASMASLISFKYIARENLAFKRRYLMLFTVYGLVFLIVLLIAAHII